MKAIPVTLTAEHKCVADTVMMTFSAENKNNLPVTVTLNTPFGTKTFDEVPAGKTRFHPFNTVVSGISAGSVDIVLTTTIDGKTATQKRSVLYPAYTC